MQKYRNAASFIGKRYVIDIDMRSFVKDCETVRVAKLMNEFIEANTSTKD